MWFILFMIQFVFADTSCTPAEASEPLEIYLLTSGPGDGVYTKVGHSALWVSGGGKRETVFNWGAYDSSQDNFLWRFFMGTTTYKLAMMSRQYNIKRVQENNQRLVAQHLDLSPNMKLAIAADLAKLARPENHAYTYHWESQNCSTLIRDLINDSTNGSLRSLPSLETGTTRRFEVLRHLGSLGWAWFGWHYMASDHGDRIYDRWSSMHIPKALFQGLHDASIQWETDEHPRPLVDQTCVLNEGDWAPQEPPNRLGFFSVLGCAIGLWIFQTRRKTSLWQLPSILWFVASGMLSGFFMFCWMFSSLEGYGFNENWFVSNPVQLMIAWSLWQSKPFTSKWLWGTIAALFCVGIFWKVFDTTPQENLEFIILFGLPTLIWGLVHNPFQMHHSSILNDQS